MPQVFMTLVTVSAVSPLSAKSSTKAFAGSSFFSLSRRAMRL